MIGWWIVGGLVVAVALAILAYPAMRRFYREVNAERAHELFHLRREFLEAKFLELARSAGNPKGAVWTDCEFESQPRFARQKRTGEVAAFVEVTAHFEPANAVASPASEVIGTNRQATAIFQFHHGRWGTSGRALFDMTPDEALAHFATEYEPLSFG